MSRIRSSGACIAFAMRRTFIGFMRVGLDESTLSGVARRSFKIRLDDGNSAGRFSVREGIDQDCGFVTVLQRIGQSSPRMPKSTTRTSAGSSQLARRRATSTPKPSSPRKMLPIPAISMRGLWRVACWVCSSSERERFDLCRIEEKTMAGLAHHSQVAARIVVEHDTDVALAFVVLLDAFDCRDCPCSARSRMSPPLAGAGARDRPSHPTPAISIWSSERLVFEELPLPLVSLRLLFHGMQARAAHREVS